MLVSRYLVVGGRGLNARKKARKVQEKKPRKNLFPSDAENIAVRRKRTVNVHLGCRGG